MNVLENQSQDKYKIKTENLENFNLHDEIVKIFMASGVPAEKVAIIITHPDFTKCATMNNEHQKTFLSYFFYRFIAHSIGDVPPSIRLCLHAGGTPSEWLDNFRVNVVRYIIDRKILDKVN